jgi:serine/threonine protein kinase
MYVFWTLRGGGWCGSSCFVLSLLLVHIWRHCKHNNGTRESEWVSAWPTLPLKTICLFLRAKRSFEEYLFVFPGGSLVDVLTNCSSPLPVDVICRIFWQTCRAIQHMHSQEPPVIHRDLKVLILKYRHITNLWQYHFNLLILYPLSVIKQLMFCCVWT